MRVGRLQITNFRGISQLDWLPAGTVLCCLIGHGDSTKSTVLDAIEAALSSRWFSFTESDFYLCDTTRSICIEVTIGELSKALLSDERFGLYIRGWGADGQIHDEPEDGDEPVLTVRLSVDATMEPVWEIVNDRARHPRTISNRDRALFGVVRLSGDDARHLTWGQGSVLSKLTDDTDEAAKHLADAYRTAKASANLGAITGLADASLQAESRAKSIGAYVTGAYGPGLELGRGGFSSGSIALHDGAVPLRLAGMGTRRLATLAIQRAAIGDGAIILVDEIEQGLEPHRILGAIVHLKAAQEQASTEERAIGQVLMTTHSDVALSEIAPASLHVVRSYPSFGVRILKPPAGSDFHRILKKSPRALFARRVLVCEGETELGLMLGIRELYPSRHAGVPIEQRGVAIVDGCGTEAPFLAAGFGALGYHTALYRDSDVPLEASQAKLLKDGAVEIFTYASAINTEQALFRAVKNDEDMDFLVQVARDVKGSDTIHDQLQKAFPELTQVDFAGPFRTWNQFDELPGDEVVERLSTLAGSMSWFKNRHIARSLAPRVDTIIRQNLLNNMSPLLHGLESWMYG
jgi:hypothetical protein